MEQSSILGKYPKYTSFFRRQSVEKLQDYEKAFVEDPDFKIGIIGAEDFATNLDLIKLIHAVLVEKLGFDHFDNKATEQKEFEQTRLEIEQITNFCKVDTKQSYDSVVNELIEKQAWISNVLSSQGSTFKPLVVTKKEKKRLLFIDYLKKPIYAVSAIAILVLFSIFLLQLPNKPPQNSTKGEKPLIKIKSEDSTVQRAEKEKDPIQLAHMFEELSKDILANQTAPTPFLARAIVAQKLMLLEQAEADYNTYLEMSGSEGSVDLNPVLAEADSYEKLDSLIDNYLSTAVAGNSTQANLYINQAKVIAEEIAKSGDKVGVDLVSFYLNLSSNIPEDLLRARNKKSFISSIATLDNLDQTIKDLKEVESVFQHYSAKTELESTSYLLAKVLIKTKRQTEAKPIVENYLPICENFSHKLNLAKFVFLQGEIASYEGRIGSATFFYNKSLDMLKKLSHSNFILYPLYSTVGRHANLGNAEFALLQGHQAFTLSLSLIKSPNKNFYAGFVSLFAKFQGIAAENLALTNLSEAYLKVSLKVAEQHNLEAHAIEAQCLLAVLEASRKKKAEALESIERAYRFRSSDPGAQLKDQAVILAYSGKVLGLLGDYSSCENSYKQALEIMQSQSIENLLVPIQTEQGLGEALWLQGKKQEARKHLESVKSRLSKLELFQKPNNLQRINFTDKTPDQILVLIN